MVMGLSNDEYLKAELERYRSYFDGATSGIFVYDPEGNLVDINPAACEMHGYSRDEMLSMNPREFIAPESHHVFDAFINNLMNNQTYHGHARGLRRDGSRFEVEVRGRLIEIEGEKYLF